MALRGRGTRQQAIATTQPVAALAPARPRVIEPRQPGPLERVREFWRYRRLIPYFGKRFIEKLYLRTWLGWLWIPLRPILDVGARVLIFGALLGVPSDGVPYLLFFLIGMSAWQFFATTTYWATRCVELNRRVLKRMYLPRLTVLVASVAPSALFYIMYMIIAAIVVAYYQIADGVFYLVLGPELLIAVAGLVLSTLLALSIGLFTSIWGAQARDVRFTLAYVLNFWFFLTPVIYPLSTIPEGFQTVASLNPMTAPIEMVRYGFLGSGEVPLTALAVSVGTIVVIALGGLAYFSRSEALALDGL